MFGNIFNTKSASNGQEEVVSSSSTMSIGSPSPAVHTTNISVNAQQPISGVSQDPNAQQPMANSSEGMDPSKRGDLAALSRLDPRALQALHHAEQETKRIQQQVIGPEQLLLGLFYDGDVFRLLEQFNVDVAKLTREIQTQEKQGNYTGQPTMGQPVKQVFEDAYTLTKTRGASFISPEDLLLSLFSQAATADMMKKEGIEKEKLEQQLVKTGSYTTAKRSILEKYGIDLTQEARDGRLDPITGRDKETERIIHILLRRTKNNPIIIGEAGVGKTAVVEALAQKIANGDIPQDLKDRSIIQLDLSSLIAGASHRGEFEERLQNVIKEAQASSDHIILFIDEIHTLIGTGDTQGAMDASNIIKPYLARGQLRLIGTTTTAEYRKYFQKDKAFERRFQPVVVEEPMEEVAMQMLEALKPKYEKFHSVVITPDAIKAAVQLSKKYIGERFLPDKAVDLLDEAAAEVKLEHAQGKRQDNQVVKPDIERVVSAWTGIPITKLTEDESQKLIHLEDTIHKRLIDQEEAVKAVSEAVRRGRIGLAAANRPIASFIFLGPTGVGKTELAKTLAEILFGREDATVRLDMSEYMEKHEVAKLIGAPPGYVGYEEGGQLTEAVRAKPYSIVLLDEIEKAHPDVFNILLQVLEDGRLTDNKGNTISFKNTIIIATSNIGSFLIQQELSGQNTEQPQPKPAVTTPPVVDSNTQSTAHQFAASGSQDVEAAKKFEHLTKILMDELHKFFKPELLNRFDELVVFKPLRKQDMMAIAKIGISKTQKLLKDQEINLQVTEIALQQLAIEGYDPVYGARPLRRLIQTAIENPVAILIIGKQFIPGDVVTVDYDKTKGEFTFVKTASTPAAPGVQPPVDEKNPPGSPQMPNSNEQPGVPAPEQPIQPQPEEYAFPPAPPAQPAVARPDPNAGLFIPPQPTTQMPPQAPEPPPDAPPGGATMTATS